MKLVLFVHGLDGSKESWGDFKTIFDNDTDIDKEKYSIAFYEYETSLLAFKATVPLLGWAVRLLGYPLFAIPINAIAGVLKSPLKIQEVGDLLHAKIEADYGEYEEIYLITHSMGGLVAQSYLGSHPDEHKVTKLMLFDVPNRGSALASISALYDHLQIKQLHKNSDFIDLLHRYGVIEKIQKEIDTQYVICTRDSVVDTHSATAGSRAYISIDKSHMEIVNPEDNDDISYNTFKNFIQDDIDDFIIQAVHTLVSHQLVVIFHQNRTHITSAQRALRTKAKGRFKDKIYDFKVPSVKTKKLYFQRLGKLFGQVFNSSNDFTKYIKERLDQNEEIFLYVTKFEQGDDAINSEFSSALRALVEYDKKGFYALVLGREQLYDRVADSDNDLSQLNNAERFYFPNQSNLREEDMQDTLKSLKKNKKTICNYVDGQNLPTNLRREPIKSLF